MTYMEAGDYLFMLEEILKNLPIEEDKKEDDPYSNAAFMDKMSEAIRMARITVYQAAANEMLNKGAK